MSRKPVTNTNEERTPTSHLKAMESQLILKNHTSPFVGRPPRESGNRGIHYYFHMLVKSVSIHPVFPLPFVAWCGVISEQCGLDRVADENRGWVLFCKSSAQGDDGQAFRFYNC